MSSFETIQQAENLVYQLAGSPVELTRRLKQIGVRYTTTNRGVVKTFILRGKNINRTEIKL